MDYFQALLPSTSDFPNVECVWAVTGELEKSLRYDNLKSKRKRCETLAIAESMIIGFKVEELSAFATEIIDKELDTIKLRADSCCVTCICCPESFSRLSDELAAVTLVTVSIAAVVDMLLVAEAITVLAWLTSNI
uniref:Uncharacterized protein n=1 Tax=Glossina austeni TaxID=7395 RepID=A0A1A9UUZ6_GLOAU